MALTEEKKLTKIELTFHGGNDVFIEHETRILKDGEVISATPHRVPVNIADENKFTELLGSPGISAKLTELAGMVQ